MVKKIDTTESDRTGDKRIKNISSVSGAITERVNREANKASKYLDDKASNRGSLSSIDRVLKNLAEATTTLSSGMRYITEETAKGVRSIGAGGARAVGEYAKVISEDISINKQSLMVTTIGKISPIVGYSVAKMMETTVFKNMISRMKEGLGKALSSVSSRFRKLAGAGWEKFKGILPFRKKKGVKEKIPKMAKGGYVKKGGMAELHAAEVVTPVEKIVGTIVNQVNNRMDVLTQDKAGNRKALLKESFHDAMNETLGRQSPLERISNYTFRTANVLAPISGAFTFLRLMFSNMITKLGPFTRFFWYGLRTLRSTVMLPIRILLKKRGGPLKPRGNIITDMVTSSFSQQNILADYMPVIARNTNDTANALVGLLSHVTGKAMSRDGIEKQESWSVGGKLAKLAYKSITALPTMMATGIVNKLGSMAGEDSWVGKGAASLTRKRSMGEEWKKTKESLAAKKDRMTELVGAGASRAWGKTGGRFFKGKKEDYSKMLPVPYKPPGGKLLSAPMAGPSSKMTVEISRAMYKKVDKIISQQKQTIYAIRRGNLTARRVAKSQARRDVIGKMIMPIAISMLTKLQNLFTGGGLLKLFGGGGPSTLLGGFLKQFFGGAAFAGAATLIAWKVTKAIINRREAKEEKIRKKKEGIDQKLNKAQTSRISALRDKTTDVAGKVRAKHEIKMTTAMQLGDIAKKRDKNKGFWGRMDSATIDVGQKQFMTENMDYYAGLGFVTVNNYRIKWNKRGGFRSMNWGENPLEYGRLREAKFFKDLKRETKGRMTSEADLYAQVDAKQFEERMKWAKVRLGKGAKDYITDKTLKAGELSERITGYFPFPVNLLGMLSNEVIMSHPTAVVEAAEIVLTSGKYTKNIVGEGMWAAAKLVMASKSKILEWSDNREQMMADIKGGGVNALAKLRNTKHSFNSMISNVQKGYGGSIDPSLKKVIADKRAELSKQYGGVIPTEVKEKFNNFKFDQKTVAAMGMTSELSAAEKMGNMTAEIKDAVASGVQSSQKLITSFVDNSQRSAQVENSGGGAMATAKSYMDDAAQSIMLGNVK